MMSHHMGLSQRTQSLEPQPLTLYHYFPCSNCYLPRVAYDGPRPDEEFLQAHRLQQGGGSYSPLGDYIEEKQLLRF